MPREKLSDEEVREIRALAGEGGRTLQEIADRYGTSPQHVHRLVRGEQREVLPAAAVTGGPSVVAATRSLLESNGIELEQDVTAATALALAEKLDALRASATAQSGIAASGVARQLAETLENLQLVEVAGPRLDALRGEAAVLVARELGYPRPDLIDVDRFDRLAVLQLKRARRLVELYGEERALSYKQRCKLEEARS